MTIDRRLFLGMSLGLIAAPAIVRASSLMPVRAWDFGQITSVWYIHDDQPQLIGVYFGEERGRLVLGPGECFKSSRLLEKIEPTTSLIKPRSIYPEEA